jgi:uncharacterized repeat protein (TIGR02543 family)
MSRLKKSTLNVALGSALMASIGLGIVSTPVPASAFPTTYTVTFAENDSITDSVSTYEASMVAEDLTDFSNLSPTFSNSGHTFKGWNTAADGSGISYGDGQQYAFTSDVELYAQWSLVAVPTTYTVTFAENDNLVDSVSTFQTGTSAQALTTFSSLSPTFSNPGHIFNEWNTAADGSGISYGDGAVYSFSGDVELFAQWKADQYVVTYSPNEGSVTPSTGEFTVGGSPLVLPLPSYSNYTFNGWYTAVTGGTLVGVSGATYSPATSMTLYAQWTAVPVVSSGGSSGTQTSVAVSFDGNGATGSIVALSEVIGSSISLPGSTGLTNSGYSLASWNTRADGSGTSYALGATVSFASATTLYAQWTQSPTIVISFSNEGGSGSVSPLSIASGAFAVLPGNASLLRADYSLVSWNTSANGSGTSYALGATASFTTSTTLYAQWVGLATATLYGAIGEFQSDSSELSHALQSQVHKLAVVVDTKKIKTVSLYGYTAETGLLSIDKSLSDRRAATVATDLRSQLKAMNVKGVIISSVGEGSVNDNKSPLYSRVEVFVL